ERDRHRGAEGPSQAIVEGLDVCYYPMLESLDAPRRSARHVAWVEGERLAFGLFEVPRGYDEPEIEAPREAFVYVLSGRRRATWGGEKRTIDAGDIVHNGRGSASRLRGESPFARYAFVCSTPWLEQRIDNMTPEEAEQARLNLRPN